MLGYYTDDGKLIYAGRVGTGMPLRQSAGRVACRRLDPLDRNTSPLKCPNRHAQLALARGSFVARALGRAEASSRRSPI